MPSHEYNFTIYTTKGTFSNVLIGRVKENPNIMAYAENKENLVKKMEVAIIAFYTAFPEDLNKLLDSSTNKIEEETITLDEEVLKCRPI
jgi:hypothetical protein